MYLLTPIAILMSVGVTGLCSVAPEIYHQDELMRRGHYAPTYPRGDTTFGNDMWSRWGRVVFHLDSQKFRFMKLAPSRIIYGFLCGTVAGLSHFFLSAGKFGMVEGKVSSKEMSTHVKLTLMNAMVGSSIATGLGVLTQALAVRGVNQRIVNTGVYAYHYAPLIAVGLFTLWNTLASRPS